MLSLSSVVDVDKAMIPVSGVREVVGLTRTVDYCGLQTLINEGTGPARFQLYSAFCQPRLFKAYNSSVWFWSRSLIGRTTPRASQASRESGRSKHFLDFCGLTGDFSHLQVLLDFVKVYNPVRIVYDR